MSDIFESKNSIRRRKIYLFILLFIILGLLLFFSPMVSKSSLVQRFFSSMNNSFYPTKIIEIGDQKLGVYISDTEERREKGLSDFNSLPNNLGMLFVFDKPSDYHIWMKDMNFPIDIFWMDENLFIIHIEKNVSPDTYPKIFAPYSVASYVLETNAGFADRYKVKIGSKVDLLSF